MPPPATAGRSRGLLFVLADVRHQSFGGEHQRGDGSRVLQRQTGDLGRIDYADLDQVAVLVCIRVVAEVVVLGFADLAENDGAFMPALCAICRMRLFERALDDVHANGLVAFEL